MAVYMKHTVKDRKDSRRNKRETLAHWFICIIVLRTQFVRLLLQVGGHESFGVGRSREGRLQKRKERFR